MSPSSTSNARGWKRSKPDPDVNVISPKMSDLSPRKKSTLAQANGDANVSAALIISRRHSGLGISKPDLGSPISTSTMWFQSKS